MAEHGGARGHRWLPVTRPGRRRGGRRCHRRVSARGGRRARPPPPSPGRQRRPGSVGRPARSGTATGSAARARCGSARPAGPAVHGPVTQVASACYPEPVPAYCAVGTDAGRRRPGPARRPAGTRRRRLGHAEVSGVYRDRTVTSPGSACGRPPAADREHRGLAPDRPMPARRPAGWPRSEVQALPGIDQANRYVATHPGGARQPVDRRTRSRPGPVRSARRSCSSARPAT